MNQHFVELRDRIIHSVCTLGAVFIVCYYFSNNLYSLITAPIARHLAPNTQIITTQVTAPFMVPMQLSFLCALLICAPYLLYQLWMFVKPGLYKHERRNIVPIVIFSVVLFYCGLCFALFVICPVALRFFTNCAPNGVTVMLDIGNYLDFIVTVAVACGIAFQIPIVTSLLIRSGIISKKQLASKRKHIIVATLIVGMLLAPPDVLSQLLLAIPMWGLFEMGLLLSKQARA
ncbi:MAG TPA: twin-arginine translocase subunit TatC [Gammaproteobacteria bacterium]|nr:twin-arginine translocase subunit TatC [Gammaproteobacteria bacterium]